MRKLVIGLTIATGVALGSGSAVAQDVPGDIGVLGSHDTGSLNEQIDPFDLSIEVSHDPDSLRWSRPGNIRQSGNIGSIGDDQDFVRGNTIPG